ncbi:hypothetical protein ABT324_30750 [Saccharopolyspora sp. NPDC000359]|uniref:hypothetical protein n=1 Tax=Saccharopolyspora sp. NPDC000359 TaxID=3154251 RepID=UPI00332631CC
MTHDHHGMAAVGGDCPLLEYDPSDDEQCPACDHVHDLCPYRQGHDTGRALLARAIEYLNHDPEQINALLPTADQEGPRR